VKHGVKLHPFLYAGGNFLLAKLELLPKGVAKSDLTPYKQ